MITIATAAKTFDTTRSTIRNWTREFSDYLSPSANPPAGHERKFTDQDGQVFALVAAMRQNNASYEAIHAALSSGERGLWPPPGAITDDDDDDDDPATRVLVTQLTVKMGQLEGQLQATHEERDHLRNQLEEAQAARLSAEIRAARAETELSTLRAVYEAEAGQGGQKIRFRRLVGAPVWWA
ncbi:MAG: MerR family transcriptional regulator [Chloroflexi bacterium]|nr:MerR family transcriptional regulator [Chloroflexota bacterium]